MTVARAAAKPATEHYANMPPTAAPSIIAICNQKGGVAKTTTCVNLAAGLAEAGMKVLVLDLDAQGNASRSLGVTEVPACGAYEFLSGQADKAAAAVHSALPGVLVIAATPSLFLSEVEPNIAAMETLQFRDRLREPGAFTDVIVIDCPPSLSVLSLHALAVADLILVPVTPTVYGLSALEKTCRTLGEFRALDPASVAVLLTLVDPEDKDAQGVVDSIHRQFGALLLPIGIPKDLSHARAASSNRPLLTLAPDTGAATAYWRLTVAILKLLRGIARRADAASPLPLAAAPLPYPDFDEDEDEDADGDQAAPPQYEPHTLPPRRGMAAPLAGFMAGGTLGVTAGLGALLALLLASGALSLASERQAIVQHALPIIPRIDMDATAGNGAALVLPTEPAAASSDPSCRQDGESSP